MGLFTKNVPAGDRRSHPAGPAAGQDLAGAALRTDPEVRRHRLGPGGHRASSSTRSRSRYQELRALPNVDRRRRHALRDRLDHPRQHLGRGVVPDDRWSWRSPPPEAKWVIAHCAHGYTSNLSLEAMDDDDVLRRLAQPRRGPRARARVAAAARGAEAVRVEEREVADRPGVQREEHAGLLGGARATTSTREPFAEERYSLPGGPRGGARALGERRLGAGRCRRAVPLGVARRLEHEGPVGSLGTGDDRAPALDADLPVADVLVAIAGVRRGGTSSRSRGRGPRAR